MLLPFRFFAIGCRETTHALDGRGEEKVQTWVRAADIVARRTDDGCLPSWQGLSKHASRESQTLSAAYKRNKSMRQRILQAAGAVLSRQEGQQLPLLFAPALIFLHPLTAGINHVGQSKKKLCSGAQAPHLFGLNAAFFQQGVRPA